MDDIDKTKEQLLQELSALREQLEKLKGPKGEDAGDMSSLEETEVLFREAIEHSNDGVIVLSGDERLYCNMRYLEIMGFDSHEEIEGKPLFNIIHPDDREMVAQYARRRQKGEEVPSSYECRFVKKDGSIAYAAISASNIIYRGKSASLGFVRDITEQKKAEEALRSSEGNLRTILDSVNDAIFIHSLDGRIIEMNSKMLDMYRVSREEVLSMSITEDFSTPDNPLDELPGMWDSVIRGENRVFEWKARRPHDGSAFDVEVFLMKITLNNSDVILASVHDITERKLAEERLRESRRFLSDLIEYSGALICVKDLDGRYELVNRKWEEVTGLQRGDVIGKTDEELFPGPTGKQFRRNDLEVARSGQVLEIEEFLEDESGKRFFISIKFPLRDNNAEVTGICGMITEITARKQMEEELAFSRDRLSRAEIISRTGNWQFDMGAGLVFASDGAYRVYGLSGGQWTIRDVQKMPLSEYRQMLDEALKALIEEGRPYDVEFRIKRPDTGEIVDIHSVAEYDREKKVVFGIIQDITDRKLLESQLLQARKMEAVGTLAGGIAHDFNNLLMGIQGYISLMLYDMEPVDPHYQKLKNIEEIVRNGSDLTGQLLGFARRGKYEVRPADINDLITRTADMFGRTRKEIIIHRKLARGLPPVEIDRGQIEQVLVNLYLNAWQAMPGGGDLYLKTQAVLLEEPHAERHSAGPGRYVKVVVSDTGLGMDEATQKRIFEPFFTTKEMGRGSGLGLASAYGVIKNHGGTIEVSSEEGRGTTFTIHLPVAEKVVSQQKEAPASPQKGSGTILVVDDQEMLLETSSAMLQILGYTVLAAGSGQRAIDLYADRKGGIDIVILDMIMPGLSGAATYDRLKEMDPQVKVILSSGYSLDGEAARILERGCNGFIQKPFNLEALSKKIKEVLEGT